MVMLNTTQITLDGNDSANDVLRGTRPVTNGSYQRYEFTLNGLGGKDDLYGSIGPLNWAPYSLAHPTEQIEIVNYLNGGAGNDRLFSTIGLQILHPSVAANYSVSDVLSGGDGDDTYMLRSTTATIFEDGGTSGGIDTIVLTAAAFPSSGDHFSLADYDSVENLRVQPGISYSAVQLFGSTADNTIWDNASNGDISGGDGADTLYGLAGDDTLYGEVGDDLLVGGIGLDSLSGGDGDDTLVGDAGNDTLYGDAGNDLLQGGAGADVLDGGTGNDTLAGGFGDDSMTGGDGDDVYGVDTLADAVFEFVSGGQDTVASGFISLDAVNYANVEVLQLIGALDLDLHGDAVGMSLIGNDGANHIYGGAGNDVIDGGAGNDSIYAVKGDDVLTGGDGSDNFVFDAAALVGGGALTAYTTTITDFVSGVDKIDLSSGSWLVMAPNVYFDFVHLKQLIIGSTSFSLQSLGGPAETLTVNVTDPLTIGDFTLTAPI
ncbi:MAG: calcium-binding protein [Pseudomonadota bacterium]